MSPATAKITNSQQGQQNEHQNSDGGSRLSLCNSGPAAAMGLPDTI
jgi:hypothetical protein